MLLSASAVASASLAFVGATPIQVALFALASLLGCIAAIIVLRRYFTTLEAARMKEWAHREEALREKLSERTRMLQATNGDLEVRVRELNILFSCSCSLAGSLDKNELLKAFAQATRTLLNVDHFVVMVHDSKRGGLVAQQTMGFGDPQGDPVGTAISPLWAENEVFAKRKPQLIRDLLEEPRPSLLKERTSLGGSLLILPLMVGSRSVGVWLLHRNQPNSFSFDDSGIYRTVANQLATALENASLYQMTRELATHDELTGLYNRRMLDSRLEMEWERTQRFGSVMGLVMLDVDHFKSFNDEYGHLVGDQVLRHVASLLLSHTRKVDVVARFGGEEFCILLPRTNLSEALHVAETLRLAIETTPLHFQDRSYSVTVSLGAASSQLAVTSFLHLLELADQALYKAKSEGRNRAVAAALPPVDDSPDAGAHTPSSRGPHVAY